MQTGPNDRQRILVESREKRPARTPGRACFPLSWTPEEHGDGRTRLFPLTKWPMTEDPTRYCLYCYARMAPPGSVQKSCTRCGRVTRDVDRKIYWTREPRLVALERAIKWILVVPAVFMALVGLLLGAAGLALFAPLLIALLSWPTVSKITAHVHGFRARIVWPAIFTVAAVPPLNIVPLLCAKILDGWFRTLTTGRPVKVYLPEGTDRAIALAFTSSILLAAGVASWFLGGVFERWRENRIRQ